MRKAQISLIGQTIVELLVIVVVLGVLFVPFGLKVLDNSSYKETTYATDQALIIDSLLGVPEGVAVVNYNMNEEHFGVQVNKSRVSVSNVRKGRVGNFRYFGIHNFVETIPKTLTPNSFEFVKEKDSLSINELSANNPCRTVNPPDWNLDRLVAKGDTDANKVYAANILAGATGKSILGESLDTSKRGVSELVIIEEQRDNISILRGKDSLSTALGCNIALEISKETNEPVIHSFSPDRPSNNGITIIVPEKTPGRFIIEPATAAYRRILDGSS